jgi:hypothetical protein
MKAPAVHVAAPQASQHTRRAGKLPASRRPHFKTGWLLLRVAHAARVKPHAGHVAALPTDREPYRICTTVPHYLVLLVVQASQVLLAP